MFDRFSTFQDNHACTFLQFQENMWVQITLCFSYRELKKGPSFSAGHSKEQIQNSLLITSQLY